MVTLSVTMTRATLSLPDLVIGTDWNAGSLYFPEDGVNRPQFRIRREYAPDSEFVPGRLLLSAVADAGAINLSPYAVGDSTAEVEAAMDEFDAATSQWSYDLTLNIDGVSRTWPADPELGSWGEVDAGMVRARLARCQIVIPLNPAVA